MNKKFLFLILTIGCMLFPNSVFADKIYIKINEAGEPIEKSGVGWYFTADSTDSLYGIHISAENEYYFQDNEVNCPVFNSHGTIVEGTFNGAISNYYSTDETKSTAIIAGGIYNALVHNYGLIDSDSYAKITGGTFNNFVNNSGVIEGGLFTDSVSSNKNITGGIFIGEVESAAVHKVTVTDGLIVGANSKEAYLPEGSLVEIESTINDNYWVYNMDLSPIETKGKTIFKMPKKDVVVYAKAKDELHDEKKLDGKKHNSKEYLITIGLTILAIIGSIGWIINSKKKGL